MTNESLWLVKLFKSTGYKNIFIKSFYQTAHGKIWDDDDLKTAVNPISRGYIGLSDWKDEISVLYLSKVFHDDKCHEFPYPLFELDFKFNSAGQIAISIDDLKQDIYDDFCKSLFVQLMMQVSTGHDIFYGMYSHSAPLIQANTEIESLISCDMMVE